MTSVLWFLRYDINYEMRNTTITKIRVKCPTRARTCPGHDCGWCIIFMAWNHLLLGGVYKPLIYHTFQPNSQKNIIHLQKIHINKL